MGKFIGGLIFGSLVAAVTIAGLNRTAKGRKFLRTDSQSPAGT